MTESGMPIRGIETVAIGKIAFEAAIPALQESHPFRVPNRRDARTPGCAERPWALELNAFGVTEATEGSK
jgi:hypothetical protein